MHGQPRHAAMAQRRRRLLAFLMLALELVALPRSCLGVGLACESALVYEMGVFMRAGADASEDWRPLWAPWQRLQASGVLQRRQVDDISATSNATFEASRVAAEAEVAARGLRACSLPSCGAREAHVSHYKLCGACKTAVYCSKAHQTEDWKRHKVECKAARLAAAAQQQP